ncbi:MAG TPA: signal recognition particle-docking protein FtsY [Lachnospiraceae bacterium]|nr:signal recognition particle-docking protein FtsY [Lachnospiraceae bacterium]
MAFRWFWQKKEEPVKESTESTEDVLPAEEEPNEELTEELTEDAPEAMTEEFPEAVTEESPEAVTEEPSEDMTEAPAEAYAASETGEGEMPDTFSEALEGPLSEEAKELPDTEGTKKEGFFSRLVKGLSKTRSSISEGLNALFSASGIDDDFYDEMEEILITSDIGVQSTEEIIETLKEQVKEKHIREPEECRTLLNDIMVDMLSRIEADYSFEDERSVVMVVGVNGAGKTTTIGKLASIMRQKGRSVLVAAADTFRAAAGEQLKVWVDRAGADYIKGSEGQDPASVVYDAMQAAKARSIDIVFCDTAGRLHNKKNLMQELEKMRRIVSRENPDARVETLIVLDGTTGQNAIAQAREFMAAAKVTGAVITKLDGTARGGIAFAIQNELEIPVKYIGVGEAIEDLQRFDPGAFVKAIL